MKRKLKLIEGGAAGEISGNATSILKAIKESYQVSPKFLESLTPLVEKIFSKSTHAPDRPQLMEAVAGICTNQEVIEMNLDRLQKGLEHVSTHWQQILDEIAHQKRHWEQLQDQIHKTLFELQVAEAVNQETLH